MRIGAVAAPRILAIHADVGEIQQRQTARHAVVQRIARIFLEIIGHDVVDPIRLVLP